MFTSTAVWWVRAQVYLVTGVLSGGVCVWWGGGGGKRQDFVWMLNMLVYMANWLIFKVVNAIRTCGPVIPKCHF